MFHGDILAAASPCLATLLLMGNMPIFTHQMWGSWCVFIVPSLKQSLAKFY